MAPQLGFHAYLTLFLQEARILRLWRGRFRSPESTEDSYAARSPSSAWPLAARVSAHSLSVLKSLLMLRDMFFVVFMCCFLCCLLFACVCPPHVSWCVSKSAGSWRPESLCTPFQPRSLCWSCVMCFLLFLCAVSWLPLSCVSMYNFYHVFTSILNVN